MPDEKKTRRVRIIAGGTAIELATGGHKDVKAKDEFDVAEIDDQKSPGKVTPGSADALIQQGKAEEI